MLNRRTAGLLLGLVSIWVFTPRSLAADLIAPQLREQIEKSRPNLGDLPAWQEEIFENEVLSASGRFIRDYKTSAGKVVKADVDLEGIKRYLAFNANQILKPDALKTILFVRVNSECVDCAKAALSVRAELKSRFERRGLVVVFATADEMRHEPSDAYSKQNAAGWILAEIRSEDDPDHPGDRRTALVLDFHFPGTLASSVRKQMEILPSDSIEISMGRLAIDAILELSSKVRTGFASTNVDSTGIEIALEGVTEFKMITQVKSKLQAALGNDYRVVEKRIERGRAALSVVVGNAGGTKAEGVAGRLATLLLEGFGIQITNIGEEKIDVQIRAATPKGTT